MTDTKVAGRGPAADRDTAGCDRLQIPVPVRWGDLDAYGHVNNVELLRMLEEARIEAFWRRPEEPQRWPTAVLDAGPGATTTTLVARTEIEYLLPVDYARDGVVVHLWLGHLGGASLDICYEVRDRSGDRLYARAAVTIVLMDSDTQRPRRITAAERAAWEPYLGPALEFRRRR